MFIVLSYLLIAIIIGLGFVLLSQYNFSIILLLGNTKISISAALACVFILLAIYAAYLIYKILQTLLLMPWRFSNYRIAKGRKKYKDILISSIGAYLSKDDIKLKQLQPKLKQTLKYTDPAFKELEQLFLPLLNARDYKIIGYDEKITAAYAPMLHSNKQSQKMPALYKLFCFAMQNEDYELAINYAREAFKYSSGMDWANNALLSYSIIHKDWGGAHEIFKLIEKFSHKELSINKNLCKQKAMLLAAQAQTVFGADPLRAKNLIKQAYNLIKTHAGINSLYSMILIRCNEIAKADSLLENWWQQAPHPDYAKIYIYGQKNSQQQQLNRTIILEQLNPDNVYSALILSEAYLNNNNTTKAQEYVTKAIELEPLRRCYLQQLTIEKFNTFSVSIEEYKKLIKAAYDYGWVGDGAIISHWHALSPKTKTLGGVNWKKIEAYNETGIDIAFKQNFISELEYSTQELM